MKALGTSINFESGPSGGMEHISGPLTRVLVEITRRYEANRPLEKRSPLLGGPEDEQKLLMEIDFYG